MDTERSHRTTSSNSSTSELFVCFTSRLSSSSMKLSSKSILSPSRSREPPQISLSSSLSRRLRNNGSMKGGQASPMFPTGGKRRGCGFENPEPSSPKVTCIGQVRVKTKKQGKKMRSRSKRRGEASFRKTEQSFHQVGANPDLTRQNSQSFQYQNHQNLQQECLKHRNQRWVHLPLTICEALREFSCFFPCRSSCMSKEEKGCAGGGEGEGSGDGHGHEREGSCGAAFARWLVALQEGDGKGREIELVMGEDDGNGRGNNCERSHSQRRHVFEDIDIDVVEGKNKKHQEFGGEEEEKGRVSICIPPKNALLLMRCRSDPVKMAALANRFWESPVQKDQDEEEEDDDEDNEDDDDEEAEAEAEAEEGGQDQHIEMEEDVEVERKSEERNSICEREREAGFVNSEEDHVVLLEVVEEAKPEVQESLEIESRITNPESNEVFEPNQDKEEQKDEEKEEEGNVNHQDETFSCVSNLEVHVDLEKPETEEVHPSVKNLKEEQENDESSELSSTRSTFIASEPQNDEESKAEVDVTVAMAETSAEGSTEENEEEKGAAETETAPEKQDKEETDQTHEGPDQVKDPERENGSKEERETKERLPECLLLMMCEPKLSMEVSKETWVCSTDFVRWLPPDRAAGKSDAAAAAACGKRVSLNSKPCKPSPPLLLQPPRSSCSFPAAAAAGGLAGMIEQKLVGSKSSNGYEPFVLTRCKSEPMRSSAKLAPEACFWKNRKMEPAPLGVGATAGVGF